jgi:uncharacterized membrane protein YfcA
MKNSVLLATMSALLLFVLNVTPSWAESLNPTYDLSGALGEAISETPQGTGKGQIDPSAPKGFAGIAGAPKINYALAVFWAVWVGWIFSTVGAFGGIMAGVGHITIFGLGDYAKSFKETNPVMNKLLTDTIRASNQYLVGLASLISVVNFYRMKRLVLPLGIALGGGSVAGALLIPWLTAGKISFSAYIGYFGIAVLVIGAFIFFSTTKRGQAGQKKSKEASAAFQKAMKEEVSETEQGVHVTKLGFKEVRFTFFGTEFHFNPLLPLLGGFLIAAISSFLGIGGGFLYVPFMTSVVGLPMFLVAGTSALAVLLSMIMSIFSYVAIKGTFISWSLVGVEMIGIFIGAMIGPRTQKYIPDIWLKRLFVVLAIYVGIRYMSKGFFGASWLPPF